MAFFETIETFRSLPSTNDYLKRFLDQGRPRAVRARRQTAGKGQYGRTWHSALDQGLYLSMLVFPAWPAAQADWLNLAAMAAVLDTLRSQGGPELDLSLKRPNDILAGGRKLCGILSELSSQQERILWAIVGVGLNLRQRRFPKDLRRPATSLLLEGVRSIDDEALASSLLDRFQHYYRQIEDDGGEDLRGRLAAEPSWPADPR
ncbi:MAG TPA: biotin--[acetyl-CoA-carboxylase] ligase [Acidobacteriota bacterium]|nr:biotin--[acetyl-CoA-carboxylase] ligase [Acidobacteriota bacterium]